MRSIYPRIQAWTRATTLAVAAILGATACDSAATTAALPGGTTGGDSSGVSAPLNLATLVNSLAFANINTIAGVRTQLSIPTGLAQPPFDVTLCAFSVSATFVVCPVVNIASMTFTTRYVAFDASGATLTQPGSSNAARIRFVRSAHGTVSIANPTGLPTTATVTDSSDVVATNLVIGPQSLSGATRSHYELPNQGSHNTTATYDLTTTANAVVLPPPKSALSYPTSGSIIADMHGVSTSNGTETATILDMHAVLTYNGTSKATLVTTTSTQTQTCLVDLSGVASTTCK